MFDWQTGVVDYGALQTDAGFAFVVDRNGEREIGLISGSRPCWGGEVLFDMPKSQHMYQVPWTTRCPTARTACPDGTWCYQGLQLEPEPAHGDDEATDADHEADEHGVETIESSVDGAEAPEYIGL